MTLSLNLSAKSARTGFDTACVAFAKMQTAFLAAQVTRYVHAQFFLNRKPDVALSDVRKAVAKRVGDRAARMYVADVRKLGALLIKTYGRPDADETNGFWVAVFDVDETDESAVFGLIAAAMDRELSGVKALNWKKGIGAVRTALGNGTGHKATKTAPAAVAATVADAAVIADVAERHGATVPDAAATDAAATVSREQVLAMLLDLSAADSAWVLAAFASVSTDAAQAEVVNG